MTIDPQVERALLAQLDMSINERGRYCVLEPARPVTPMGALCECAVRVQLRLCIATLARQLEAHGQPCPWCRKSRGWKNCADHGLLEDLQRAANCQSDRACAWDWAYALGGYLSAEKYAWGFWTAPAEGTPSYVRGASDDAAAYSRAVWEAL